MRAVLDPNVLISSVLSRDGSPARVLRAGLSGEFEIIASPRVLTELARALAYPKLRKRISADEAEALVALIEAEADVREDPTTPPPVRTADPDDDYIVTLAAAAQAVIVSGDEHLLELADRLPVYSPAEFLALLHD